ncbi:MAG: TolC family protein [Tepidisphaeraceae bacterium]
MQKSALTSSLDLRISRSEIAANLKSLGVAQPLGVLSQLEAGVVTAQEDNVWYTGPSVTLPVPIFSQGQPAVARAVAKVRLAEANYYATAVDLRSAVRAAHARVVMLRQQVDRAKQSLLPLRQQIVEQSQQQYNAMQIGTFELLAAKRSQIEAGDAYLRLLSDYWSAKTDLDQLLAGRMPVASKGSNNE